MIRFQKGKTYSWLFPWMAGVNVIAVTLSLWLAGHIGWGLFTAVTMFLWLVASEIYSGVILDAAWCGRYVRGTRAFFWMLAYHLAGAAWATGIVYYALA